MIQRGYALLGLLALFLQGSTGGHMLLVEHSRCAEHGELVHGGEPHPHSVTRALQLPSPAVWGTPDAGSKDAHEHCSVSANRRDVLDAIVDAGAPEHRYEAPQALSAHDPVIVAPTPRFRVAPKTSPPA